MLCMLCRNTVFDFSKWKRVFDSQASAHRAAGLLLLHVWRTLEEPDNVFFVFEVRDINKARAFISSPDAAEAGKASRVLDGEYHFVESTKGY